MDRDDAAWKVWTREHRVAYEVAPLVETMDGGGEVRSGFTLTIYAAAPELRLQSGLFEVKLEELGRSLLDGLG